MHQGHKDDFFAAVTGIIAHIVGVLTTESIIIPLLMALAGGFLGYVGKHFAIKIMHRFFPNKKKES